MSDVIWNLGNDNQTQPYDEFFLALQTGLILGGTATSFSMKDGPAVLIFHGSFTLSMGTITAGEISSFQLFHNSPADTLMDVSGYSIDFIAFKQAVIASQNNIVPIFHLLFDPNLIVNGANQFVFELLAGGFGSDQVHGNGGPDFVQDFGGSDVIYGGEGNDKIEDDNDQLGGAFGDDFIFGEGGDDVIKAGRGDDVLSGGDGADELDGGEGSDTADYSEKLDTVAVTLNGPNDAMVLVGGFAEDTVRHIENVIGGVGDDKLVGDGLINRLAGGGGNDRLRGNDGSDSLFGDAGRDKIKGGRGKDEVHGGPGKDSLGGGPGKDTFYFESKPGPNNVDRIKDYAHADTIALDQDIFAKLGIGKLKAGYFHVSPQASDANDRIIYDESGALYFDKDGVGGVHQVKFAKLTGHPDLDHGEFLIV